MKQSRYTEEQIIGILKEQEAAASVAELCRRHGMSDATFYNRKSRYGGLEVSEAKRLRGIAEENTKLKQFLADAMLDNAALNDLLGKNGDARRVSGSGGAPARKVRNERATGVSSGCGGSVERALSPAASGGWPAADPIDPHASIGELIEV
jgi:putative transposase